MRFRDAPSGLLRVLTVTVALAAGLSGPAIAEFKDPLKTPALRAPMAARAPMTAIARVDANRFVAVGWRGVIIVSADKGETWQQAQVPVRTDLTAVTFVDAKTGWVVGNDGVVLRSDDGGLNWTLVLDGPRESALMLDKYQRLADEKPDDAAVTAGLRDAKSFAAQLSSWPLLDVMFEDAQNGYVAGNFNLLFRTRDGGKTWDPEGLLTDNPDSLNIYAVRRFGQTVVLAGELGFVRTRGPGEERFTTVKVPYDGTLFTGAATDKAWVLAGLRGNAVRSTDSGKTWQLVDFGAEKPASFLDAAKLDDNSIALLTPGGVYVSRDNGQTFRSIAPKLPMRYSAMQPIDAQTVLLAGQLGVRKESLR